MRIRSVHGNSLVGGIGCASAGDNGDDNWLHVAFHCIPPYSAFCEREDTRPSRSFACTTEERHAGHSLFRNAKPLSPCLNIGSVRQMEKRMSISFREARYHRPSRQFTPTAL